MRQALNIFFGLTVTTIVTSAAGCSSNAIIDKNAEVDNHNWSYLNKYRFDVKIENQKTACNLYLNLRVTDRYKYANMFVLITQVGPDKKATVTRYELKMADKDGAWLGNGSGNLYSYQLPFLTAYKFPFKGPYSFYIEQNMRDNPLREVTDVGLRVETAR